MQKNAGGIKEKPLELYIGDRNRGLIMIPEQFGDGEELEPLGYDVNKAESFVFEGDLYVKIHMRDPQSDMQARKLKMLGVDIEQPYLKITQDRKVFAVRIDPDTLKITLCYSDPIAMANKYLIRYVRPLLREPEEIVGNASFSDLVAFPSPATISCLSFCNSIRH